MSGIRLHHPNPSFSNVTYVVELPQSYPVPYQCPTCGKQHDRKAIHLHLDANGDVIVSQDVYEKLQTVFLAGMTLANEIDNPPPLELGAVDMATQLVVEQPLNGAQKAADFYVPGRTKYESRDRMWAPFQPLIDEALEAKDREETKDKAAKRKIIDLAPGQVQDKPKSA